MPAVTFSGLASGLDTQALIDAILDFESRPVQRMQARRSLFDAGRSALSELESKLKGFEAALGDLSSAANFRGRTTSVSDESVLRATAGSDAETGLFQIEVSALATASKVKSDGFAAADQSLVADGTITLQSGNQDPITIDVSVAAGNNSLSQVRDAINAADAGVQASVLFDGTSYRLIVRSEETGSTNALNITDTTDLNLGDAGNQITSAGDATFTVDGIPVTSASNKVGSVIPGVTLDLLSSTGGAVTVEIAQDNERVIENVQSLVDAYNELTDFLSVQVNRESGGALANDTTTRSIQGQIQSLFTSGVDGIEFGGIRSLASIGVDLDGGTGKASLDSARLAELLETDFEAVGNLFLTAGTATDPRIRYLSSNSETVAGTYAVTITQAAEQARVEGGTALTALGQDETLSVDDGSTAVQITLTAGQDLGEVVDTLNQAFAADGVQATALAVGGKLQVIGQDYGSAASISVQSDRDDPGDGTGTGFGLSASTDSGVDVEGSIDGVAGQGIGQVLSAAADTDAEGLQLQVLATDAAVVATGGDFGTVSFSRGLVSNVLASVDELTRLGESPIAVARDSLSSRIDQINDDIERLEVRLASRETALQRSFAAAERAIQALQAQQGAIGSFF